MQVFASIILANWANQSDRDNRLFYIFAGLTLSSNIFIFLQALVLTFAGVRQGRNVHNNIIKGLLYADLIRFFNRVPLGRILNRLNKDLKELD
jgi:ABC-type multidrug transport system fused ATPase/permease subunit